MPPRTEVRDAANTPQRTGQTLTTKKYPSPNVNRAKAEKARSRRRCGAQSKGGACKDGASVRTPMTCVCPRLWSRPDNTVKA